MTASTVDPRKGRWIPWAFVGGFGIVLLANGIMITVALTTFTGLSSENYYRRGIEYNKEIARKASARALGWSVATAIKQTGGKTVVLTMALKDKSGQPISGASVAVNLVRPVAKGSDQHRAMTPIGNGRYRLAVDLPLYGQWEIRYTIDYAGGRQERSDRLVLRAPKGR
jgi:nitrogen fixation protein FixH